MANPIVFASSMRKEGATPKAIELALAGHNYDLIDLSQQNFSDYDPERRNSGDDFLSMAEQMVQHSPIILACPVYWYSVPAIMKRFIDRWSDLLDGRKDIARRLQGKEILLIAPYGTYPEGTRGFEEPIKGTAEYMLMQYKGCFFYYTGEDPAGIAENPLRLQAFRNSLPS
jgi:putative NADPH-quinone reductase